MTESGTGALPYNVGKVGSYIGLEDDSEYRVLRLLGQANRQKRLGRFNRRAFNYIFSDINRSNVRERVVSGE